MSLTDPQVPMISVPTHPSRDRDTRQLGSISSAEYDLCASICLNAPAWASEKDRSAPHGCDLNYRQHESRREADVVFLTVTRILSQHGGCHLKN